MRKERHTGGEEGAESPPATFGLFPIDRSIQTRLLDACRALLKRATPAQVRDLAYLIHALQRLPLVTPEVTGGVDLTTRYERSAAFRGFAINADEFVLSTGESMQGEWGTDHESRNVLEVGTDKMRNIYEQGDDFSEWLNLFCEMAEEAGTEIEINCDVNGDPDLHEDADPKAWEKNPLLDEP